MDEVAVAEFARAIVEARDAELAFELQVQEAMRAMADYRRESGAAELHAVDDAAVDVAMTTSPAARHLDEDDASSMREAELPAMSVKIDAVDDNRGCRDGDEEEDDDTDVDDDDYTGPPAIAFPSSSRPAASAADSDMHVVVDDDDGETDLDGARGYEEVCQICCERTSSFFCVEGCGHRFCESCTARHAEARVMGGGTHVTCLHAGCPTVVSTQLSRLLCARSLEIWTTRQIEAAIPASERLYCPFPDCSTLLMRPDRGGDSSSSMHPHATAFGCVECESCHRLFCMECAVPWHSDLSCAEYQGDHINQRLAGDKKLLQLADQKKWQRCGKCKRVVELSAGCHHVTCL